MFFHQIAFPAVTSGLILLASAISVAAQDSRPPTVGGQERHNLGDLLQSRIPDPLPIDERRVRAAGIEIIQGNRITLYTDTRNPELIAGWDHVFDQAIEFWCEYFGIDPKTAEDWRLSVILMELETERFRQAGLYPADLPPFPAGYQRGHEIWMFVKPGDYYTRHLLLHEGTHAFMEHFLGGTGPPWYAEGIAELLAVHRWDGERLEMNVRDIRREEVPYWGRVKLVQDDLDSGITLSLTDIFASRIHDFQQVRWYGWAWAACRFLDSHPRHRDVFHQLAARAADRTITFSDTLRQQLSEHWDKIEHDWKLFLNEIDYGVDVEAILVSEAEPIEDGMWRVAADRGWQDTGLDLESGEVIELVASGRFVVRYDTEPWISEANGVTIEYHQGLPLGRLIAAIQTPEQASRGEFEIIDVGNSAQVEVPESGRLHLRINESPAELRDNEGTLEVAIRRR